jgi:HK97 gp10 family phage protein
VNWYGEEISKKMDIAILSGLTASAITLEAQIVKKIEAMHIVDTGRYVGSITYRTYNGSDEVRNPADGDNGVQSKPTQYEAFIGTNVSYAPMLERGSGGRSPRPAIRQAFDESKELVQEVFSKQAKKMMQ